MGDIRSSPNCNVGKSLKSGSHMIQLHRGVCIRIYANVNHFFKVLVHLRDGCSTITISKIVPNCLCGSKSTKAFLDGRIKAEDKIAHSHIIASNPSSNCSFCSSNFCSGSTSSWVCWVHNCSV